MENRKKIHLNVKTVPAFDPVTIGPHTAFSVQTPVETCCCMKRTFHICLSSHDEVMFRDEDDYNRGFNTFALALYKTDSIGLVESFMSDHVHMLVQTEDPDRFIGAYRMP